MALLKKSACALLIGSSLLSGTSVFAANTANTSQVVVNFNLSISLGGTAFTSPSPPTIDQLRSSTSAIIGNIDLTSNTTMCGVSVSTTNDFVLLRNSTPLATFEVGVTSSASSVHGNVGKWSSNANNQTLSVACSSIAKLTFLRRSTDTFDVSAPNGSYSDVIRVAVANQ